MIHHHIMVLSFFAQRNHSRKITHFLIVHVKKWMLASLKQQTAAGLYSCLGNKDESIIVHPNTIKKKTILNLKEDQNLLNSIRFNEHNVKLIDSQSVIQCLPQRPKYLLITPITFSLKRKLKLCQQQLSQTLSAAQMWPQGAQQDSASILNKSAWMSEQPQDLVEIARSPLSRPKFIVAL